MVLHENPDFFGEELNQVTNMSRQIKANEQIHLTQMVKQHNH